MMQSIFGDSLIALGLWIGMSMVTLLVGALIARTIVSILGRRENRRREPLRPWCSGWTDGTVESSPSACRPADRRQLDHASKRPLRRSVDQGAPDATPRKENLVQNALHPPAFHLSVSSIPSQAPILGERIAVSSGLTSSGDSS